jgi:outer membrane receptor protein involved in Fe transport
MCIAGTGGKLSGKTVTAEGEILPYVTIMIEELGMGSQSDENGIYFILNVPPGKYDVKFSYIGYKFIYNTNVIINSDLTTVLNASLERSVIPGEAIYIKSEKPLIRKDATSKIVSIGADEIINMPVDDFEDVLITRAGFTEDSDGGIHLRGGRVQEILYMIDGIEVNNSTTGSFDGMINQSAIQELTVISGTFNAEYGTAMSGIVNIITKEGNPNFKGSFSHKSDVLSNSRFHSSFAFDEVSDPDFANTDMKPLLYEYIKDNNKFDLDNLRIPLLDLPVDGRTGLLLQGPVAFTNLNYFLSSEYRSMYNYLPHFVDIGQDVYLKLTALPTEVLKISGIVHSSTSLSQDYSHRWKYLPENNLHKHTTNDRYAFIITHTLANNLFYTGSFSNNKTVNNKNVRDLTPDQYIEKQTGIDTYFYRVGNDETYSNNSTTSNEFKLDVTYQINNLHHLKSGLNYTRHHLSIYNIEEPWQGGANFVEDSTFYPIESSFYFQDKIEYDFLIMNIGIRYDNINPNIGMWEDVRSFGSIDPETNEISYSPIENVPSQSKWSPRFGIAYPVTDKTVFHFSYGHFFQSPSFDAMIRNPRKTIYDWAFIGNPRVKPQKTISFETGIKQELSHHFALEITAWTKDIRDLLSAFVTRHLSIPYVVFINEDYASVKGIDLSFFTNSPGLLSGSLDYTLSVARGNNATPLQGYFSAYEGEEIPHQEYYLDFDQRHRISTNLNLLFPEKFGPDFLGFYPLENLNTNILINSASGLPYTPYVDPGIRIDRNSERKPWTFTIDLKAKKSFQTDLGKLTVILEIKNLTNYENIKFVYSRTGDPFDTGGYSVGSNDKDSDYNPSHISPGREISIGFRLDLD